MKFSLAESPLYVRSSNTWFWVDINAGALYAGEYKCTHLEIRQVETFAFAISSIVEIKGNRLLIAGESNLLIYNCCKKQTERVFEIPNSIGKRCNDGSVGPDGKFWFGTMDKKPDRVNGEVFSFDGKKVSNVPQAYVGIPNSFVWLNNQELLISDSLLQKTFKVRLTEADTLEWKSRELWLDLSDTQMTPDGGALDSEGNIWLAIWGGAAVHKYSPSGTLLDKIELNALQPTACAFGGEHLDVLLITTASEGMTEKQLALYPDSGGIIMQRVCVPGTLKQEFLIES